MPCRISQRYYGDAKNGQYLLFPTIDEYLEYINERLHNVMKRTMMLLTEM